MPLTRPTRRQLLVGGGAGIGLLVAWQLWPRESPSGLAGGRGEHVLGPAIAIGQDGSVRVAVPQVELGHGALTGLAQLAADELGADWSRVAVGGAALLPAHANLLLMDALDVDVPALRRVPAFDRRARFASATGWSSSIRAYAQPMREAGAVARMLLCQAAAERWDADWRACDTADGYVILGNQRLPFGALATEAGRLSPAEAAPLRTRHALAGQSLPRLDLPAHVDGTLTYAADVRLPDMVIATLTHGPVGAHRLQGFDRAAAEKVTGFVDLLPLDQALTAVATNSWAATKALEAARPRFAVAPLPPPQSGTVETVLQTGAPDAGSGHRLEANYDVGARLHAALEPLAATAQVDNGRVELWAATQAPGQLQADVAAATGMPVRVHPVFAGGSFGRRWDSQVGVEAARLAVALKRPVQLFYTRGEDSLTNLAGPTARVVLSAQLAAGGQVTGWRTRFATPDLALFDRAVRADPAAFTPPYAIPNLLVERQAVSGPPGGDWRGREWVPGVFATECFVDELAAAAGQDAFGFRMGLLGSNPRLAACLSRVAELGEWQGGAVGTNQGLACAQLAGSCAAVFASATMGSDGRPRVTRLVAAIDAGQVVNPQIVRQQVAGGLVFGLSAVLGVPAEEGSTRRYGALGLPRLADAPRITIELLPSRAAPGGVGELLVPPTPPAIANALYAATGTRYRSLPIRP